MGERFPWFLKPSLKPSIIVPHTSDINNNVIESIYINIIQKMIANYMLQWTVGAPGAKIANKTHRL